MQRLLASVLSLSTLRVLNLLLVAAVTGWFFLAPGVTMVRELSDDALGQPGVPEKVWRMHHDLSPRIETWARSRVVEESGKEASLYDVPTTEWPMFTAVFYLLATEELQSAWEKGAHRDEPAPVVRARGAVDAARDLIVDPSNHAWVRTHWGDDYLHRENVFFRSLLISGLTSHAKLTGDPSSIPMLRDQVESLATALDRSERGVLHDYPGECYPIDVLAAVGFIRRADPVLGTDHSAFVARAARAFEGSMADDLGLVPYRMDLPEHAQVQPSRGIGTSWIAVFAPDLWPDRAARWYAQYEASFWQKKWWAEGFREFARGRNNDEWQVEVDAGPVLDGFGTSASAFGIAAARRNGRFDHAYTLSAQLAAASWTLPDGTALAPRAMSHAAAAPYLGESAIMYFHAVQPAAGVPIVTGGHTPGLVYFGYLVYFGVTFVVSAGVVLALRRVRRVPIAGRVPRMQAAVWLLATLGGFFLLLGGHVVFGVAALVFAQLLPTSMGVSKTRRVITAPAALRSEPR